MSTSEKHRLESYIVGIPPGMSDDERHALNARMHDAYAEMVKNMNADLYGDHTAPPRKPLTFRERLTIVRERIHDAWLVLTGRAEIGDGW